MTNLITSEEEIKKISKLLELLRSRGYNQKVLEEILDNIIPNNDKYDISYNFGHFPETAFFIPNEHTINISVDDLKKYVNIQMSTIKFAADEYKEELQKELFNRLVLFVLLHEVEHVKQYLMGEGFMKCPYNFVRDIYKNLFTFNCGDETDADWLLTKQIIFFNSKHRNSYKFVLERNANIMVYGILSKICDYETDMTFKRYFEFHKAYAETIGYFGIFNGAAETSYRKLLLGKLYDSFFKNENICTSDRILYGLPLDYKTRLKVLSKPIDIYIK